MSQKLSVATRTGAADQKHKKILEYLRLFPEGTTPKTIARETGLNVNTVKSILPRLRGVKKIMRGFYKVVEGGDGTLPSEGELRDWNFHNLVLSSQIVDGDFNYERVFDFGLCGAVLSVGNSGKATFRLSSDWPLNVSSIAFVAGFFREVAGVDSDVFVSTIEFNRDFSNLRLDGVKCITVGSLVEQFKVYQKRRGLRVEHKSKVPFSMENIVDMLSQNPNSLESNVKLAQQSEQLDRLTQATSANTKILFKLIDGLKQ